MGQLPAGTITLLFTDSEGSTALLPSRGPVTGSGPLLLIAGTDHGRLISPCNGGWSAQPRQWANNGYPAL